MKPTALRCLALALPLAVIAAPALAVEPNQDPHNTCETAIAIKAADEFHGIGAEHYWTDHAYPGSRWQSQTVIQCPDFPADKIDFVTAEGHPLSIYFDVSQFMGKL
jgi:hypothetical protein